MNFIKLLLLTTGLCAFAACSDQSTFPGATESSLEEVSDEYLWRSLDNDERVDSWIRVDSTIFCGDSSSALQPMQDIDFDTFQVWPESNYARDSTNVYYPLEVVHLPVIDTTLAYCRRYVVEGVQNPYDFRYLRRGYGTDNLNVFYKGVLVEDI